MKESKILVTGGAGFIGHHFIEYLLKNTNHKIVSLDRLDVSGNLNRLSEIVDKAIYNKIPMFELFPYKAKKLKNHSC